MRSIICFFALFQLAFLSSIHSVEEEYTDFVQEERIYITSEDIIITATGIHYKNGDDDTQIQALFSDEQGLFILMPTSRVPDKITDRCDNGHPIYDWELNCLGCAHPWCPFRCRHHSLWQINE